MKNLTRCPWALNNSLYIAYHDLEWGVPLHDEQQLFAMLILEGMQAGLNWLTVLKKRESFYQAFDNFSPEKIARYSEKKIAKLLTDPNIIRNSLKIRGAVKNARGFLAVREQFPSFNDYIWQFTNDKPIQNAWKHSKQVPASTHESDMMSKDLKRRGFTFVGTTICYAYMQAIGMVNDHLTDCFRHREIKEKYGRPELISSRLVPDSSR